MLSRHIPIRLYLNLFISDLHTFYNVKARLSAYSMKEKSTPSKLKRMDIRIFLSGHIEFMPFSNSKQNFLTTHRITSTMACKHLACTLTLNLVLF